MGRVLQPGAGSDRDVACGYPEGNEIRANPANNRRVAPGACGVGKVRGERGRSTLGDDTMKLRCARVAKAAISGATIKEMAASESVSERQVFRILAKPEVRGAIDAAMQLAVRSSTSILQRGAEGSARALVQMANGEIEASVARVAAARGVIEHAAGRPMQRTELTGKDGKDLIPATKDQAIEALRAVMPKIAAPPAAPAPPPPPEEDPEPTEG